MKQSDLNKELQEVISESGLSDLHQIKAALEIGAELVKNTDHPLHLADSFHNQAIDTEPLLEEARKATRIQKRENQARIASEDPALLQMARKLGRLEVKNQ